MRVLRVYHAGGDPAHRARDHALRAAGACVTLVIPSEWPESATSPPHSDEDSTIISLEVARCGDVNRHSYSDPAAISRTILEATPDIVDIHEEPFSVASRQWLAAAPPDLPVVMYTAQNVDKRFPPPFTQYEHAAHRRVAALYPCSSQAASVARGKGFGGVIDVLPLGYDDAAFYPGSQSLDDELVLGLFGRLVPEKGVTDAVEILARLHTARPTRLVVVGNGPEEASARARATARGVADRLDLVPWQSTADLAATYRTAHVVLVPSRPTATWVEQFGRVIVEAQASGAVVAGYASGSIPEVAGDAAILAQPGEAAELAARLIELVADPTDHARRRELGIAVSQTRTWAQVAERQADLYRRVVAGDVPRLRLPRSPAKRRATARTEFGPTAATIAGTRPFALPLLRNGGPAVAGLGRALDMTTELVTRLRDRQSSSD